MYVSIRMTFSNQFLKSRQKRKVKLITLNTDLSARIVRNVHKTFTTHRRFGK